MSSVDSIPPTLSTNITTYYKSLSSTGPSTTSIQKSKDSNNLFVYEIKLKTIYNLSINILDTLMNTSYSILLININNKTISLLKDLRNLKNVLRQSSNSGGGLSSNCFRNSMLLDFNKKYTQFLKLLDYSYSQIFMNDKYLRLSTFKQIYSTDLKNSLFTPNKNSKDDEINEFLLFYTLVNYRILLNSKTFELFNELNGVYDKHLVIDEYLTRLRNDVLMTNKNRNEQKQQGLITLSDDVENKRHNSDGQLVKVGNIRSQVVTLSDEQLQIINSSEFKSFNYNRFNDLGFFKKTIF